MTKSGSPSRNSHLVLFFILKFFVFLYTRIFLGYRCRDKYKIKKGEVVIVLSNHQTDYDPLCIMPCFSRMLCAVATDNIFSGKLASRLLTYLNVIPKKKGAVDIASVMKMRTVLENGASVLLFPEGNRYYAEFQYYISPSMAKFIKSARATVILFNLHGGNGVSPRFKHKNRRGRFYGEIKRIIPFDEYADIENEEFNRIIKDGIRVYDSDSCELYKSDIRAEYLERMLFVCPKCGSAQTLFSEKQYIKCSNCGLTVEYGENLHLKSDDLTFSFSRLIDWWNFQKKYMCDIVIKPGETVFSDTHVRMFSSNPFKRRELIAEGKLEVDDTSIRCGDRVLPVSGIDSASVVSGRKLTFSHEGNDYMIKGDERFNPLKYVYLFNKLDTEMKRKASDRYFNPEE